MASFAAARALWVCGSLAAVGLAACSEEKASSTGSGTTDTTTGVASGGGGSTSGGGDGGSGATTTGTGASTASSGGGGTGGSTTTGTGGTGAPCGTFAQRYGGSTATDEDQSAGAVVDANGGAIVAGEFNGVMTVGAQKLTSAGGKDAFVVRLDAGGSIAWAKRYGSVTYDERVKAVAALPDGGAVLAGTFDGAVDFGGTTLTSIVGPDAFVLRLDAAGGRVFVLQLENADARAVAVDDGGDILVVGDFKGTTTFGNIELTSPQSDVFAARVSPAGDVLAAKSYVFPAKAGALAVAAHAGRTYLAGSFQGSVDFGTGLLTSAGSKDVFVARLTSSLDATFAKRFGDDTSQEARSVAVLSDGSVAIAGSFRGKLDLGGTTLVADTQDDAFVGRLDENGGLVFGLRFGDADTQTARSIAVGSGDGLIVGGGFHGTIDPGDGPVTSEDGEDAFVTWLDPQGVAVKTLRWGGALDQRVRSVSVDPCGAVLLGGDFTGSLPIGGETLAASGLLDVFVARLAP
jgi:hypothetical protein